MDFLLHALGWFVVACGACMVVAFVAGGLVFLFLLLREG
jgi:hypothetical protein